MKEARVGSLPWFAGVFWLLLATLAHGLATAAFRLGDQFRQFQRPSWWTAWKFIALVNWCNRLAYQCALEAGAEE